MTTDWDRIERLLGQGSMALLRQKTVGVIGLGSGGGYVALSLAMTGVQRFILLDDDVLDAHNIVRHVADYRDIGRPKVEAVADLIKHRNPNAQVEAICDRFENRDDVLERVDLVVVGVDNEGAKFSINEACLEKSLVAVYAGVYERGEGGDAVIIRPYDGPCYACWAGALREGYISPLPDEPVEDLDYGQRRPDGSLAGEPGLWLDVVRVANTQANLALNVLLEGTNAERVLPANTILIANQPLEILHEHITPPFSAEWVNIPRHLDCLVCGTSRYQAADDLPLNMLLDNKLEDDLSESMMKSTGNLNDD